MDIKKMTNDELKSENKRLEKIFEECKTNINVLLETMDKASQQYTTINDELKNRGIEITE